MKKIDCLCFGSIVLDYRRKLSGDRKTESPPLQLTNKPIDFRIGGIPILAIILECMGFNTAVIGQVGKDIPGYGVKSFLGEKYGIDTEGIKFVQHPTSCSIINLTDQERYIQHNIGANAFLEADEKVLSLFDEKKPKITAIGYSGLLPAMDANNGIKMAEFIAALKAKGIKTALDTHTMRKDYSMLAKPLGIVDIFFCNEEEAKQISGKEKPDEIVDCLLASNLEEKNSQYRVLGITYPNGTYICYGKQEKFVKGFVKSPWYSTKPKDLTGAGDAFRAGFYAYLLNNMQDFENGTFNWYRAGMLGNFTASVVVTKGYKDIDEYTIMLDRSNLI